MTDKTTVPDTLVNQLGWLKSWAKSKPLFLSFMHIQKLTGGPTHSGSPANVESTDR